MGPAGPPGPVGPTGPAAEPWPSSVRSRFGPAGEAVLVELAITGTACPSSEYVVPAGMAFAWSRVQRDRGPSEVSAVPILLDGLQVVATGSLPGGPILLPPGTTVAPVCDWWGSGTAPSYSRLRLSGELFPAPFGLQKLVLRSRRDPQTNHCAVELSHRPQPGRQFRVLHALTPRAASGGLVLDGGGLGCSSLFPGAGSLPDPYGNSAIYYCSPPLLVGERSSLTADCRNSGDASELDLNEILVIGVEL